MLKTKEESFESHQMIVNVRASEARSAKKRCRGTRRGFSNDDDNGRQLVCNGKFGKLLSFTTTTT